MVEWIVRRAQGDRARVGTLTGMVCILANVALCAAKGAIGVVSGSVSIVADAMNNLSDASSNIVSVLGFKLASKPADPEHPYGMVVTSIFRVWSWRPSYCLSALSSLSPRQRELSIPNPSSSRLPWLRFLCCRWS